MPPTDHHDRVGLLVGRLTREARRARDERRGLADRVHQGVAVVGGLRADRPTARRAWARARHGAKWPSVARVSSDAVPSARSATAAPLHGP